MAIFFLLLFNTQISTMTPIFQHQFNTSFSFFCFLKKNSKYVCQVLFVSIRRLGRTTILQRWGPLNFDTGRGGGRDKYHFIQRIEKKRTADVHPCSTWTNPNQQGAYYVVQLNQPEPTDLVLFLFCVELSWNRPPVPRPCCYPLLSTPASFQTYFRLNK